MKLKTLYVHAFGKFVDKRFDFEDGLNLIHGLNEAGKSTLHACIEAMFYGFVDPTKSIRKYYPENDLYEPIASERYGGSVIFELDHETYRLTRNLQKRRQSVSLIIEKTGKDITDTLDIDPVSRMPDIAKFIDLPYLVYQNTLSVKQLKTETQQDVSDELMRRMQNLATTKTETISAQKAIDALAKEREDIGTDRASTKPYYKALKHRDALETEKTETEQALEAILTDKTALVERTETYQDTLKQRDTHRKKLQAVINTQNHRKYDRIIELQKDIETLHDEAQNHAPYEAYDQTDMDQYSFHTHRINTLKESLEDHEKNHTETKAKLEALADASDTPIFDKETLREDRQRLYDLDRLYQPESLRTLKAEIEALQASCMTLEEKVSKAKKPLIYGLYATLGTFVLTLTLSIWLNLYPLLGLLSVPFIVTAIFFIRLYSTRTRLSDKQALVSERSHQVEALSKEQTAQQAELKQRLDAYGVTTLTDFETLYTKSFENMHLDTNRKQLKDQLKTLEYKRKNTQETLNESTAKIKALNKQYKVNNLDDMQAYAKRHRRYHEILQSIEYKEALIENQLGDKTLASLKASIDFDLPMAEDEDTASNEAEYDRLEQSVQQLNLDIQRLKQTIDTKLSRLRDLESITYDLYTVNADIEAMDARKALLEAAIARITRGVERIESHFAPLLSEHIADYLKSFTADRYDAIKVKKDLTFSVFVNEHKLLKEKAHFSTGTKDQIYFAMRLGILDTLKQHDKPLFLDDAFIAYDDERLTHALHVLNTMQKNRQIILFTCQSREGLMLTKHKIPHHSVSL